VYLAEPYALDTPGFRALRELEDVAEGLGLARALAQLFDEDPDVHG
jgi:hypothetical protein